MRWVNRVAAAAIAVAIVVGPPMGAALWIQSRHWRFPTATQALAWFGHASNQDLVAAMVGSLAVAMWLLLVVAVVLRARYVMSGLLERLRRTPMPTAAQMAAGSVAGVAALAMPSVAVAHPAQVVSVSAPSGMDLADAPTSAAPAGIELPGGGWIPYRTAVAVTVLGGAIWLHRRQHYQPANPRFGEHGRDGDLQPLPGTAEAIIAGVGEQPSPDLTVAEVLPRLPAGRLILHGPGAVDAARGLLVTTILAQALTGPRSAAVVLHPRDLEVLVGTSFAENMPPGLHTDGSADGLGALGAGHDQAGPPSLLIRPPRHRPQEDGDSVQRDLGAATVVLIGDDGHEGTRWHVSADGSVTGASSVRRLALFDVQAANDLLTLVQRHAGAASFAATRPSRPPEPAAPRRGQLRLLDDCRLLVDGTVLQLSRSAGLQILAYLAVHPNGTASNDLIRAVWPGFDPNRITKRLHTTLTALRQQLHPVLDDAIVRHDERYQLNRDVVATDLEQLHQAVAAAATAVTADQRTAAAQAIVDAYRGELAAGFCWPWLQPVREAVRRDVIDAYLQLAAAAPRSAALDLVRAAIAVDPYNEALHDEAVRILTATGDHEAAHALREALRQRLLTAGLRPAASPADSTSEQGADLRL
jgi:DNA-binding SARP family transcriptional activator